MQFDVREINRHNKRNNDKIKALLAQNDLEQDENLDYILGIFDENGNAVATGSCFKNTLRCIAVHEDFQGFGLLSTLMTHLLNHQYSLLNEHIFLYTKINSAKFFSDLGFFEIARTDSLVFMENKRNGFSQYLENLECAEGQASSVVMNGNPFTLGHLHLLETACKNCDILHLFIVSEDLSLVPFAIREKLIIEGTKHLKNIIFHRTGDYLISSATFPSYFLKDSDKVSFNHGILDAEIFVKISKKLGITSRYVGEENFSTVTNLYNQALQSKLQENGIDLTIIPRKCHENNEISASDVRLALKNDDWQTLKKLVPAVTFDFFKNDPLSVPIIEKIKNSQQIIHH